MIHKFNSFSKNSSRINEEAEITPDVLSAVQNGLHSLEQLFLSKFKIRCKLSAKITGRKKDYISISSNDLSDQVGPVGNQIFSSIQLDFWQGKLDPKENNIWFLPKVSYYHPSGGSNSTSIGWNDLLFDLNTNTWIEGDLLTK